MNFMDKAFSLLGIQAIYRGNDSILFEELTDEYLSSYTRDGLPILEIESGTATFDEIRAAVAQAHSLFIAQRRKDAIRSRAYKEFTDLSPDLISLIMDMGKLLIKYKNGTNLNSDDLSTQADVIIKLQKLNQIRQIAVDAINNGTKPQDVDWTLS